MGGGHIIGLLRRAVHAPRHRQGVTVRVGHSDPQGHDGATDIIAFHDFLLGSNHGGGLVLERAEVIAIGGCPGVTTLIHQQRVAVGIDGGTSPERRAARQERVCQGRATVVLKRTEERVDGTGDIGANLVAIDAATGQTAAAIAVEVVAQGDEGCGEVNDKT